MYLNLILLEKRYSIYKFESGSDLPDWIYSSDFYSITSTTDELSVVTLQTERNSEAIICSRDWRILKIAGPLDLSFTGIIASITDILKAYEIPVFVLSTYDTDYILVKQAKLDSAVNVLTEKGYTISK
jgi:uncharacterized protein